MVPTAPRKICALTKMGPISQRRRLKRGWGVKHEGKLQFRGGVGDAHINIGYIFMPERKVTTERTSSQKVGESSYVRVLDEV